MDTLDPIALYGAVLATITAGWEIVRGIRARKPRLRVEGKLVFSIKDRSTLEDMQNSAIDGSSMSALDWRADISVVNVGSSNVQIAEAYLQQSHKCGTRQFKSTKLALPHSLAPGERVDFTFVGDAVDGLEANAPIRALTRTGKGVQFKSDEFGHESRMHISVGREVLKEVLGKDLSEVPGVVLHEVTFDGISEQEWATGLAIPAPDREDAGLN